MTQEEWDNASKEERDAEFERCKNPVYLYNTYWVRPDGSKPEPITAEQWEQVRMEALHSRMRRVRPLVDVERYPLRPEDCTPVGQGKVVMQATSTLISDTMLKYVDQMNWLYLKLQQAMGIPRHRLGIDPARPIVKDKFRVPRKLKKKIKAFFNSSKKISKAKLKYGLDGLKYSKYYGGKMLKEQPAPKRIFKSALQGKVDKWGMPKDNFNLQEELNKDKR